MDCVPSKSCYDFIEYMETKLNIVTGNSHVKSYKQNLPEFSKKLILFPFLKKIHSENVCSLKYFL